MIQKEKKEGSFESLNFDPMECSRSVLKRMIWQEKKMWTLSVILLTMGVVIFFIHNKFFEEMPYVMLIPIFYYGYLNKKAHGQFMKELAEKNGLKYEEKISTKEVLGNLFKKGHSGRITQVINGDYGGHKARLFYYTYTVSLGQYSTTYKFTVFELFLGEIKAPYMLLQHGPRRGVKERDEIKITLEEEFKNNFNLYVKDGYGIEAMQIFTKDFLHFLQYEKCNFSIELKENRIYVYCKEHIRKKKELEELYETSRRAFEKIRPLLKKLENDFNVLNEHYNK